jgi:hypothetical protein
MRKSINGECANIEMGKPPINLPDGEIISIEPPPKALMPRNNNNPTRIFRARVSFIIICLIT